MSLNSEERGAPAEAIIRRARRSDARAISGLLTALGYPSQPFEVEKRMADGDTLPGTVVFVAESSARVIGVVSFHCIPLFHADGYLGRITSMVVDPEFRRRGIGRLLVSSAEKFGWEHGCTRMEVTSGDHRADAHAFYEHLGYQVDCRRFIKRGGND